MSIADYIRDEVLRPRLQKAGCLVVYDPERRYRDVCLAMASEGVEVVDASESSIESREAASAGLLRIGRGEEPNELLIYAPAPPPTTDEDRQGDPFAAFAVCGASYPNGAADDYLNMCLKAKPDHATAIRQIFANDPNPPFAVIDKIGGGVGWPALRSLLGTDSPSAILFALLAPSEDQKGALKDSDAWVSEARDLMAAALGLKLKTRAKAWSPIADELWRYVLFSEFAFDLPGELPDALAAVPRAGEAARPLVEDLCDRLASRSGRASDLHRVRRGGRGGVEPGRGLRRRRRPGGPRYVSLRGANVPAPGRDGARAKGRWIVCARSSGGMPGLSGSARAKARRNGRSSPRRRT
jgi:hypothetical protein